MITGLQLIRNVGKYLNWSGPLSLKQTALIYADNGRGKTTLTAILRSLGENQAVHILNRQRLGITHRPEIRIGASQRVHVFQNGAWDVHYPDIQVFDDHFIEANVYSGLVIGRDQRIGLHEVILGAQSVELARDLEQVIADITTTNGQIRQAQADLQPHAAGMPIDEFIELQAITDAEQQIQTKESLLNQIRQVEPIRRQGIFEEVVVPEFRRESLSACLALSIADLEQAAITRVQQHFTALGPPTEQWVRTGMTISGDHGTCCPYCGQGIQHNDLIEGYRAFFSQEYESHVQSIAELMGSSLDALASAIGSLHQAAATTEARRTFWIQYVGDLPSGPDYETMAERAQNLHDQLREVFSRKRQSPLAPKQAYADWHESPQGSRRLGAQQARLACQAVMCFPWLSLFHAPFSFHNI